MAAHFVIAIGLALVLAVGFGIVVRLLGDSRHQHHRDRARVDASIVEIGHVGVRDARRPVVPLNMAEVERIARTVH